MYRMKRLDISTTYPAATPQSLGLSDAEWADHDRRVAAQRAAEKAREADDARRREDDELVRVGVPRRPLRLVRSESFNANTPAVAAVRSIGGERGPDGILVLAGGVGTGKTVAAVSWLLEHHRWRPLFVTANKFESLSRYDRAFRAQWESAGALVLDDLGMEYLDNKGNFLANLDELIAHYHANLRGLVITTNLTAAAFKERYSERIVSRIREAGRFVNIAGSDRRSKPRISSNTEENTSS